MKSPNSHRGSVLSIGWLDKVDKMRRDENDNRDPGDADNSKKGPVNQEIQMVRTILYS